MPVKAKGREHFTNIGNQPLFVWEKKATSGSRQGVILFVHGSVVASLPTFDLQAQSGPPESSIMDWFAARGFDTWCFDHRGHGRSYKGPEILATIADGADDITAVSEYIRAQGSTEPLLIYGQSSGALRAAVFTERHPERVKRLVLDAFVWTGKDSPTLEQRRKRLAEWRASNRRPIDRAFLESIFTRDHPGYAISEWLETYIEQALAIDNTCPNGTYIDMCANLPVVDPSRLPVPTLIMRGEFDGVGGMEDLLAFFSRLPNGDKEFAVMPGIAHAAFLAKNYRRPREVMHSFFTRSEPAFCR
jgi:alpha-beta hydrolase superfamily lysophospholipase